MSSPAAAAPVVSPARSMISLGMEVHKDSITIAVLPQSAKTPTRLEKLANDLPKLKKWIERVARDGEIHACYEASGAGYVLHRALAEWGYACDVIAPSLIPKRSGVHRKHDKRDAADLARLYRAGELVAVRIPSEADERVRDVVRCRETFQREILKSRHYILKFLAKRGFVFREGTNWCTPHLKWLQHLTTESAPLAAEDRLIYREYHALLMYKLQRREELDRQIERLAELPTLAPMVKQLQCFRGISVHSAMVLATARLSAVLRAQTERLLTLHDAITREIEGLDGEVKRAANGNPSFGMRTATSSPARYSRAGSAASRWSCFRRTPDRFGISDGAITSQAYPTRRARDATHTPRRSPRNRRGSRPRGRRVPATSLASGDHSPACRVASAPGPTVARRRS